MHQQLDTLTEQASTGLVAETYAGLWRRRWRFAGSLNPQLATLQTYQNNINPATGSMQVTQSAMTQIQQIAATFVADMPDLNALNATEVDSVASNARTARSLRRRESFLDTTDGQYICVWWPGQQQPGRCPIPDNIHVVGISTHRSIRRYPD